MALVLGTNVGFVTVSPDADPAGGTSNMDNFSIGIKDTTPADVNRVTEIGFWCDNATQESNFEVGIYSHHVGNDAPDELLAGVSRTNAKGTTAGWKKVTGLNIEISPETIYWICVQLDDTATPTTLNYGAQTNRYSYMGSQTTLVSPWASDGSSTHLMSFYAVVEEVAVGTNIQVNVDDALKDVAAIKVNVDDAWKDVDAALVNKDDAWKTIF